MYVLFFFKMKSNILVLYTFIIHHENSLKMQDYLSQLTPGEK